jgi:hypothetical protein
VAPLSPVPVSQTSSQVTAASASFTATLPSYQAGDYLLLVASSNNAQSGLSFSGAISSSVALPSGGSGGGRLLACQLVPNGLGQTTFTVTGSASAVWTWWIANYRGASTSLAVATGTNASGNSTAAAIAPAEVSLPYIATGNEVMVSASAVNSTATWVTDANTQFRTTANNAALMADAVNLAAGTLTGVPAAMNRGNSGSSRNQNSLALVLQTAPGGPANLLSNPSFEQGSALATGWTDEHTTAGTATYSLTGSGVVDGTLAQSIVYAGQGGDTGSGKLEVYQAPVDVTPGQYLTFALWVSGSLAGGTYADIGIESFEEGGIYISEADSYVTPSQLSATPEQFSVSYLVPAGAVYIAAYIQFPEIGPSAEVNVILDAATLTAGPAPAGRGLLLDFLP